MTHPEPLRRDYLYVALDGPPDTTTVAQVLRLAAERLEGLGPVDVHDVSFAASVDSTRPSSAVTVYYERIERRRVAR